MFSPLLDVQDKYQTRGSTEIRLPDMRLIFLGDTRAFWGLVGYPRPGIWLGIGQERLVFLWTSRPTQGYDDTISLLVGF